MADSNTLGGQGNGLGSTTTIVKLALTNMTAANMGSIYSAMGNLGHTVAGSGTADGSAFVAGTTDVLFIALQGVDYVAIGTDAHGVTGAVTTVEAIIG
jgi:hypothetical protein|tara:strand:+ start:862 stop:1155 length:294 start_codon:yes stop_codon:yes gene_type:complete